MNSITVKNDVGKSIQPDSQLYIELQQQPTTDIAEIEITNYTLGKLSIAHLVWVIESNSLSLQSLTLWCCELNTETSTEVANALRRCQQCLRINIIEYSDDGGGAEVWANLFLSLNNLQVATFHATPNSHTISAFAEALAQQTNSLECLHIWGSCSFKDELEMFYKALKDNTIIRKLILPTSNAKVPKPYVEDCFMKNNTIMECIPYERFGIINRVCKELHLSYDMKKHVPKHLSTERQIRMFMTELSEYGEQWRKLKIVFLGHGEVGKTTLLCAIKNVRKWQNDKQFQLPMQPPQKIDLSNRTIGVDVSRLSVGNGGEASVWDFGGQLEYAVTHQFLLSIELIPKIMAEFISPDAVRRKLVTKHDVIVMNKKQIGAVLAVNKSDEELEIKLMLMEQIGVCFKLVHSIDNTPCFLFPSLASHSDDIRITLIGNAHMLYAGMRLSAPENTVFTTAFFCLVMTHVCSILNISQRELIAVHKNGIVVACLGLFCGQLLVKLETDMRSIVVAMLAYNPTLNFAVHVINQLIQERFDQYSGYVVHKLCPSCISKSNYTEASPKDVMCLEHKVSEDIAPIPHQLALVKKCRTHKSEKHHLFLSYRVSTEGTKSTYSSTEGNGGFVELLYWKLAPHKLWNGDDTYVFWDKMCLNDGQDFEAGFLHGITSTTVIILLLSNKVIEGMLNAYLKQDNVLVEYECALLQNRKHGTPVIPVFLAEKNESQTFVPFDFGKALKLLPNKPHVRKSGANNIIANLSAKMPKQKTAFLSSISHTLQEVLRQNGIFMSTRGEDPKEMQDLTDRIMSVLQQHQL